MVYLKGDGIPRVLCFGNNETHNILIIELLNKSLENLYNTCHKKFSIPCVCLMGIQMV